MKQRWLAGFAKYGATTRRAQFMAEQGEVVTSAPLEVVVEPSRARLGPVAARQPIRLEGILRLHLLQLSMLGRQMIDCRVALTVAAIRKSVGQPGSAGR